jgi:hypothetical protein
MAKGDPLLSPWTPGPFGDYLGRAITITVNFDNTSRALINAVVHRDSGCLWHTIVFDNPSDAVKSKRLAAPADGAGDRTYTAAQLASQGLSTIDAAMAVQITAEP